MRRVIGVCALVFAAALFACSSSSKDGGVANLKPDAKDPASRVMTGTLLSYRPTTSILLIAAGTGKIETMNNILCKYNKDTKFFIDGRPATLDQLQQYMTVTLRGRVTESHLLIQEAHFSSQLPANVKKE